MIDLLHERKVLSAKLEAGEISQQEFLQSSRDLVYQYEEEAEFPLAPQEGILLQLVYFGFPIEEHPQE